MGKQSAGIASTLQPIDTGTLSRGFRVYGLGFRVQGLAALPPIDTGTLPNRPAVASAEAATELVEGRAPPPPPPPPAAYPADGSPLSSASMDRQLKLPCCRPVDRGLHSFTFHLNVSACCGIGGASRGNLEAV